MKIEEALIIEKSPEELIYDKLIARESLTLADIQSLEIFNDAYIIKLLGAGQETARYKVAEALSRPGMIEVRVCD